MKYAVLLMLLPTYAVAGNLTASGIPNSPIDFSQELKDPRGAPLKYSEKDTWTLGLAVYQSLSMPEQSSIPGRGSQSDPATSARNSYLAWTIYGAKEPIVISTEEKALIRAALFRASPPPIAQAACRLIVPVEECSK